MLDKKEVQFEHPAKGPHHCSQCVHFLGHYNCEIVRGFIESKDWCNRWKAKKESTVDSVGV